MGGGSKQPLCKIGCSNSPCKIGDKDGGKPLKGSFNNQISILLHEIRINDPCLEKMEYLFSSIRKLRIRSIQEFWYGSTRNKPPEALSCRFHPRRCELSCLRCHVQVHSLLLSFDLCRINRKGA